MIVGPCHFAVIDHLRLSSSHFSLPCWCIYGGLQLATCNLHVRNVPHFFGLVVIIILKLVPPTKCLSGKDT